MIGIISQVRDLEDFLGIPQKKGYSFIKEYNKSSIKTERVLTVKTLLS